MKTNNTIQLLSIAINSRTVNIGYNHLSRYFPLLILRIQSFSENQCPAYQTKLAVFWMVIALKFNVH